MFQFRVRIDVENLRKRLSRASAHPLDHTDVVAWLSDHGFQNSLPDLADDWAVDYVADDSALNCLKPWEVLERLPTAMIASNVPVVQHA